MDLKSKIAAEGLAVVAIGTDLVEVSRIARACKRRGFLDRIYSLQELEFCFGMREQGITPLVAKRLATRFAAKEATLKAMGVGLGAVRFKDIEIVSKESGEPTLVVHGSAKLLADDLGLGRWLVSLSHSEEVAQAFVVGLSP